MFNHAHHYIKTQHRFLFFTNTNKFRQIILHFLCIVRIKLFCSLFLCFLHFHIFRIQIYFCLSCIYRIHKIRKMKETIASIHLLIWSMSKKIYTFLSIAFLILINLTLNSFGMKTLLKMLWKYCNEMKQHNFASILLNFCYNGTYCCMIRSVLTFSALTSQVFNTYHRKSKKTDILF